MDEPSVLDYFKALLTFWRDAPPAIPPLPEDSAPEHAAPHVPAESQDSAETRSLDDSGPSIIAAITRIGPIVFPLILALIGQFLVEQDHRSTSLPLYLLSAGLTIYAFMAGKWTLPPIRNQDQPIQSLSVKTLGFMIGLPFSLFAYVAFGGNRFTSFNVFMWFAAVAFLTWGLWLPKSSVAGAFTRVKEFFTRPSWNVNISRWAVIVLLAFSLAVFFRTYQLNDVNQEMISSHIEKLHDVYDIQENQNRIFFERNTGRLGLQMYLTAGIIQWFNTGLTFISLKLGTVLAGLFMLPYMYLLGKEVGNRWVGLLAVILCGIAFWPNILGRIGLRFILYPAFVAPALYYLLRGLRRGHRNDFILSGIALGIGLYGYAPIRVLPLVIVAAVILFALHRQSEGMRRETWIYLGVLLFIALLFFLPQFRFLTESEGNQDIFNYRTLIRLGELERPYPGPPILIFIQNMWDAIRMTNLYNASDWTVSIPQRPMLDAVTAALFFLGVILIIARYIRERHWLDIFLLLAIPMLVLPSALSLAFPVENPSNTRAAGAMVPVFLIAAIALESLLRSLKDHLKPETGMRVAVVLGAFFIYWSASINYSLVFNNYKTDYNSRTWNTSEMGAVIGEFTHTIGDENSAWMLVYPHWGDSRLVALHAGFPYRSYELFPDQLSVTLNYPAPKIFIVHRDHQEGLDALRALYPLGITTYYQSETGDEGRDFYIFLVPPERDS